MPPTLDPPTEAEIERAHAETVAMFEQWAEEDRTDDPAELARREREREELKTALNEGRGSGRKIFP